MEQQTTVSTTQQDEAWARDMLYNIATEALREQRQHRKWKIVLRLVTLAFIVFIIMMASNLGRSLGQHDIMDAAGGYADGAHIGVVEVNGVIAPELEASSENIIENLESAFSDENAVAIVLRINSPGGSPVESGRVNDAIVRLRSEHSDKKVYAVVDDICASGGYYIAVAADEIYADKASVVGSIGVLANSFGFVGLMEKLGVERRLATAGENKAMLDPFSPLRQQDQQHLQDILDAIHQQFIDVVLAGRGELLQGDHDTLFSGLFWSGAQALELGLIDGMGDSHSLLRKLREETGIEDLELVLYSNIDPLERILAGFGTALAEALGSMQGLRLR